MIGLLEPFKPQAGVLPRSCRYFQTQTVRIQKTHLFYVVNSFNNWDFYPHLLKLRVTAT